MAFEFILLAALIFIFLVSFCGLLQKIKQTYDRERLIAERIARRRELQRSQRSSDGSFDYPDFGYEGGILPGGPPPYTEYHIEPPPKYEDIVKIQVGQPQADNENTTANRTVEISAPLPYTITIASSTSETSTNR